MIRLTVGGGFRLVLRAERAGPETAPRVKENTARGPLLIPRADQAQAPPDRQPNHSNHPNHPSDHPICISSLD